MEVAGKDQSSVSANAKGSSSSRLLRYPLRSAGKPKEEKPPLTDSSNSSAPRRGKPASSVSKSISVLDLSNKEKSAAKPPRRLSIQSKPSASPASRAVGTVTPISEVRTKRSVSSQGKTNTPVSAVPKRSIGNESNRLSSSSYWLSQIKLSESAAKHSISLGFFKLALEAGCEPLDRLRDELKSYVQRHRLVDLGEPVKQLFECYNILQDFEQLQVSETFSHEPEDGTRSSDDEVRSSSSVAGSEKVEPKALKKDATETCQVTEPIKESSSLKEIPTKTRSFVCKTATTPKATAEVSNHSTKKKIQKQKPIKQEPNKDKVKRQGKESAQVEGPANACTPERILPEDKENLDALQSEEINTREA